MGALMAAAQAVFLTGRTESREIEAITTKLHTQLALQAGAAIKVAHGSRLVHTTSQHTLEWFDQFVEFDRTIREKKRSDEDQADLEVFCHAVRQAHANSLLAIRQAGVEQIETIIVKPLDPPIESGEEVIVEQVPGLWGRLVGGQKITRIKR